MMKPPPAPLLLIVGIVGIGSIFAFVGAHSGLLGGRSLAAVDLSLSSTSSADQSGDTSGDGSGVSTPVQPVIQYKILQNVDPCTLNVLGKAGWDITSNGSDQDSGITVLPVAGTDENCQNQRVYPGFLWVLLRRVVSGDTSATSSRVFKLVQSVDGCTLNTFGAQGWDVSQTDTNNLIIASGSDENCNKVARTGIIQWVLFTRQNF